MTKDEVVTYLLDSDDKELEYFKNIINEELRARKEEDSAL